MNRYFKICFIANPNSNHTRRWVDWFHKRGHQVSVIADNVLERPWPDSEVYDLAARVNISLIKYFVWSFWLRGIIRQWQPDIVHAHRVSSAGWLGAFSGFHPFVVTPWGSDIYLHPYRSRIARWLAHYVLHRADLITADSEDLRRQAIHFGAAPNHTHVVQWGIDLKRFNQEGDTSDLRKRLNIDGGPIILSPRSVKPVYNLEIIIQAIPRVCEVFPDAVFVLRDYSTRADYRTMLKTLIADLSVQDRVRWLASLNGFEEIADTYRLADIVVSIPSSDGTPVSVLEAMACGTPVIVSDLPSLREWIVNGKNGLLVPVGDTEALAEAIVLLLRDDKMYAKFREANLDLIRERANHQVEMEKMERLYQSLL